MQRRDVSAVRRQELDPAAAGPNGDYPTVRGPRRRCRSGGHEAEVRPGSANGVDVAATSDHPAEVTRESNTPSVGRPGRRRQPAPLGTGREGGWLREVAPDQ